MTRADFVVQTRKGNAKKRVQQEISGKREETREHMQNERKEHTQGKKRRKRRNIAERRENMAPRAAQMALSRQTGEGRGEEQRDTVAPTSSNTGDSPRGEFNYGAGRRFQLTTAMFTPAATSAIEEGESGETRNRDTTRRSGRASMESRTSGNAPEEGDRTSPTTRFSLQRGPRSIATPSPTGGGHLRQGARPLLPRNERNGGSEASGRTRTEEGTVRGDEEAQIDQLTEREIELARREIELEQREAELEQREAELEAARREIESLAYGRPPAYAQQSEIGQRESEAAPPEWVQEIMTRRVVINTGLGAINPFGGNGYEENPQEFMRAFRRGTAGFRDEEKVKEFVNCLRVNSVAEDWWLETEQRYEDITWDELVQEFDMRWPRRARKVKTMAEVENDLLGMRMEEETLGRRVMVGGQEEWSHVAWAMRMEEKVRAARWELERNAIVPVHNLLPSAIRREIGSEHANWIAFLEAVRGVNPEYIAEEMEAKRAEERQRQTYADRLARLERAYRRG